MSQPPQGEDVANEPAMTERQKTLEKKRSALSMLLASIDVGKNEGGAAGGGLAAVSEGDSPHSAGSAGSTPKKASSAWGQSDDSSSPANKSPRSSKLGVAAFIDSSGERHVAIIMNDGAGIREPSSGKEYSTVIEWMESKSEQPEEDFSFPAVSNLNDWADDSDSSSSSSSDEDEEEEEEASNGTTHEVTITTIYSSTGAELKVLSGNNVIRLSADSTWHDFKEQLKVLAENSLLTRVSSVQVFRPADPGAVGADAVGGQVFRLDELREQDSVYISVPESLADLDDDSYSSDDSSSGEEPPEKTPADDSGSDSDSDSDSNSGEFVANFDADDFSAFERSPAESGGNFGSFNLEAAAAEAAATRPAAVDEFEVSEDEWNNASQQPASHKEEALPRTASDMDTLALLAAEVRTSKSPKRRRAKGAKLFGEVDEDVHQADTLTLADTLTAGSPDGGRPRSRSGSHSHNNSVDFDAMAIDFSSLGLDDGPADSAGGAAVSLHGTEIQHLSESGSSSSSSSSESGSDEEVVPFE